MAVDNDHKSMIILFATIFLVGVGFSIIMPVLPYYAESMGANALQLTVDYRLCRLPVYFCSGLGSISDRVGRRPVLLTGILGYSFTFILFGFATKLWMLYNSYCRRNHGWQPCLPLWRMLGISPVWKAPAMGMIGAAMGMGMVFGPAIGGILSGISLAFLLFLPGYWPRLMPFPFIFSCRNHWPVKTG